MELTRCLLLLPPPPPSDEGFGVGHTRLTQTKGVWLWGEPVPVQLPGGETTNVGAMPLHARSCVQRHAPGSVRLPGDSLAWPALQLDAKQMLISDGHGP